MSDARTCMQIHSVQMIILPRQSGVSDREKCGARQQKIQVLKYRNHCGRNHAAHHAVPMARRPFAPAPVEIAKGNTAQRKGNGSHQDGRNLLRQASSVDSIKSMP